MRVVEILFCDPGRVKLVVAMPEPDRCTTADAPHVPRSLFRLFPHLAKHRCRNGNGYSFRREAMATELPHLLEHLIIELQSQAHPHPVLRGETEWNWQVDPRGTFHVYVDYENEQLVLAAIRLAERILNAVAEGNADSLEVAGEIARLRRIARLGEAARPSPGRLSRRLPAPPRLAAAALKGGES